MKNAWKIEKQYPDEPTINSKYNTKGLLSYYSIGVCVLVEKLYTGRIGTGTNRSKANRFLFLFSNRILTSIIKRKKKKKNCELVNVDCRRVPKIRKS